MPSLTSMQMQVAQQKNHADEDLDPIFVEMQGRIKALRSEFHYILSLKEDADNWALLAIKLALADVLSSVLHLGNIQDISLESCYYEYIKSSVADKRSRFSKFLEKFKTPHASLPGDWRSTAHVDHIITLRPYRILFTNLERDMKELCTKVSAIKHINQDIDKLINNEESKSVQALQDQFAQVIVDLINIADKKKISLEDAFQVKRNNPQK